MRTLLILLLVSCNAIASECKLTGILQSEQQIETVLVTATVEGCRDLAIKTGGNNFFGLIEKEDRLMETRVSFRKAGEVKKDTVSFETEVTF